METRSLLGSGRVSRRGKIATVNFSEKEAIFNKFFSQKFLSVVFCGVIFASAVVLFNNGNDSLEGFVSPDVLLEKKSMLPQAFKWKSGDGDSF